MTTEVRNIAAASPFLRIILPAVAGLAAGYHISIPVGASLTALAISFAACVATRKNAYGASYLWLTIALFFFTSVQINRPSGTLPYGHRITVAAQVEEKPHLRGRWQVTTARVGYFRADGESEWTPTDESIQLLIDTCYKDICVGSQLIFRGWINPIDTTGSSYGRLMALRGLFGRMYLVPGNLVRRAPYVSKTPAYYSARLQEAAIAKLETLDMPATELSVVTAMTAGDKRGIGRETRASYNATGTAHLLAVSGLHVGIVFILVNLLLYWLPAARRGHIVRNVVAVAIIWLYACMTGLSPSAMRAALMFSFAQAAIATSSYRNALNIMLGSAVVMLAINPNYIADPSFLLSYSAVLSIFAFFPPLYRLVRSRYKAFNILASILLIGLTATIGTAPLVAYWFGNFPLAGMVVNPLVSLTAHVIVMFGVLWTVMPFGIGGPVFSWILSSAAGVQNALIEWCAARSWASIAVEIPLWSVICMYIMYIAAAIFIHTRMRGTPRKDI